MYGLYPVFEQLTNTSPFRQHILALRKNTQDKKTLYKLQYASKKVFF